MAPVFALVTNPAVIEKPLKVGEIPPPAVWTLNPSYARIQLRLRGCSERIGGGGRAADEKEFHV